MAAEDLTVNALPGGVQGSGLDAGVLSVIVIMLIAAFLALRYYVRWLGRVRREGGRVRNGWVDAPDVVLSLTLGGAFIGLTITALSQASATSATMTPEMVISNMKFFLVLSVGLIAFLLIRKVPVLEMLGLRERPIGRSIGIGLLMLIIAVPILFLAGIVTVLILKDAAQQQELVKLFADVVRVGDDRMISTILIAGVIIAPITEELIFRGYFYPVAKRYLGAFAGALVPAILFGVLHGNLASLPNLVVLALCFTLAYERTGSLLTPIGMHMLFNASNLLMLYVQARRSM